MGDITGYGNLEDDGPVVFGVPLRLKSMLQRVLQQGRSSLRRLLRVADEVQLRVDGLMFDSAGVLYTMNVKA